MNQGTNTIALNILLTCQATDDRYLGRTTSQLELK